MERAGIVIPEENEKSEPFSYREKVRIFIAWCSEKDAIRNLKERLEQAEAENERLYAIKRDFERVWNYFGAKKMNQAIGLMREQEQTAKQDQQENRKNSIEL